MAEKDDKKDSKITIDEKESADNEKLKKKRKLILIVGVGGVLLLVIVIGGFFIFKTLSSKHAAVAVVDQNTQNKSHANSSGKDEKDLPPKDSAQGKMAALGKDGGNSKEKDEQKKEINSKPDDSGTPNFGDTFSIPRMDLNIGNPLESAYLRVAISIEYRGGKNQEAELKKREIELKDIIITEVTKKSKIELLSSNGKELLRRTILNRINEVADRPIKNIFFTEFLVE